MPPPLIFYYFVEIKGNPLPAGSMVILPEILVLAPTPSSIRRSPDTAANINSALIDMIINSRNAWKSEGLAITSATFNAGTVNVALQGKISAPGDIVLIAARMQFLMTVFAEPDVQNATITLNGKNIANWGISHESEARPVNYAYSRAEIETYIAKNAYKAP